MRIGIVTDAIDDGASGIGTYVRNLVKSLAKADKINDYFLIHYNHSPDEIYELGFEEIIIPIGSFPFARELRKLFLFPLKLRKYCLDVVHETSQMNIYLLPTNFKKVVTIHDLIPLVLPEYSSKLIALHHKIGFPLSLYQSDKVICVSESTEQDLFSLYSLSSKKVEMIYEGRGLAFKRENNTARLAKVKKKYRLPKNYYLSVATLTPRKNLERVLRAFSRLKDKKSELFFVGRAEGETKTRLIFLAIELGIYDRVRFAGWVDKDDLPALYSMASACVFTTLYEGFGLPILEAQACGCPVITSNVSSMPEIAGSGALFVTPTYLCEIETMLEIILKPRIRSVLIGNGYENVKRFNWARTARMTREVYERLS